MQKTIKLWQRLGLPPPKSEASGGPLSLKDYEVYSGLEVPEGPLFVRLDGWRFHAIARQLKFKKPFDKRLAQALVRSAKALFSFFPAQLCYIFSDELNFLFYKIPGWRRVEKIDSVFAGLLSSAFYAELKKKHGAVLELSFDCRCIPMLKHENVAKYLIWRQAECFRNHNNAWAQHILLTKERLSPRSVNKKLEGLKVAQLFVLAKKYKIDLNKTPAWQRLGILLYREPYTKVGYDPIKKKKVKVQRFRIVEEWEPPKFTAMNLAKFLQ